MQIGEFSASKNMLDIAEESVIWKGNNFCVSLHTMVIKNLRVYFRCMS